MAKKTKHKIMGMDVADWLRTINTAKNQPLRWQPKIFVERFVEYMEWVANNPIKMTKVLADGSIVDYTAPRAPLKKGFESFVGRPDLIKHTKETKPYKNGPQADEYQAVIAWIQGILFEDKFTGAAVGIYNASLISKELGLVERQEMEQRTTGESTIVVKDSATADELAKLKG